MAAVVVATTAGEITVDDFPGNTWDRTHPACLGGDSDHLRLNETSGTSQI